MSRMEMNLFGPPRLVRDGQVAKIGLRKALALLAYLAVGGRPHSRDALATLFWPESDQQSGRASLRRTLYLLNQTAGSDVLDLGAETVAIAAAADIRLDVQAFQDAASAGLHGGGSAEQIDAEALANLLAAAELYTDDFLAGFSLLHCPSFDDWQSFHRDALSQTLAQVLGQLIRLHCANGTYEQAIPFARRALALDPLHEPAHRELIRLYASSGQPAAALRQFEECARILDDEFGVRPQPETIRLYESARLAGQQPDIVRPERERPDACYVNSGDIHIAYHTVGDGPIDLLFVSGFISHLEHKWEEPRLVSFIDRLAGNARLIFFDKRGVGLSDRVGYPPTLENTMDDMLAVMDAVGSDRPVLFGLSEGGPNCALFAATYPERVSGMILYGTLARGSYADDHPWALTRAQFELWLERMMAQWGGPAGIEYFAPGGADDPDLCCWWARMLRLGSSPGSVKAVLEVMRDIDVRPMLPQVRTPTLVLHRSGDRAIRVGAGRCFAAHVPGAAFVELSGDDHWPWIGDMEAVLEQVEAFLSACAEQRSRNRCG